MSGVPWVPQFESSFFKKQGFSEIQMQKLVKRSNLHFFFNGILRYQKMVNILFYLTANSAWHC